MPTRVPSILDNADTGRSVDKQPSPGTPVSQDTMNQMLAQLETLLSHTHSYTDDYGTACNCNCNCDCTCTRGTL